MHSPSRRELLATAALGLLSVLVALVWLDAQRFHGKVIPNVSVAGHDIGGMGRSQLDRFLADLEDDYRRDRVHVAVPGGGL